MDKKLSDYDFAMIKTKEDEAIQESQAKLTSQAGSACNPNTSYWFSIEVCVIGNIITTNFFVPPLCYSILFLRFK
jgi:hypothetical protein